MPRRAGLQRSTLCAPRALLCSGARGKLQGRCGAAISHMTQVLSTAHRWSPIGGELEKAWFVNAVDDSVRVGPSRTEQLAQGQMVIADAFCGRCGANVGWKFVSDDTGQNRTQVGRYGLVLSSVRETDWNRKPLVAALEDAECWAAVEMQESPLPHRMLPSNGCRSASRNLQLPDQATKPERATLVRGAWSRCCSASALLRRRLRALRLAAGHDMPALRLSRPTTAGILRLVGPSLPRCVPGQPNQP